MIYYISLAVVGIGAMVVSSKTGDVPVPLLTAFCVIMGMRIFDKAMQSDEDSKGLKEALENHEKVVEQLTDLRGQFNILKNYVGQPNRNN